MRNAAVPFSRSVKKKTNAHRVGAAVYSEHETNSSKGIFLAICNRFEEMEELFRRNAIAKWDIEIMYRNQRRDITHLAKQSGVVTAMWFLAVQRQRCHWKGIDYTARFQRFDVDVILR